MQKFSHYCNNEFLKFSFIKVPEYLFTYSCFDDLSLGAKMLYGLLLDRLSLSVANGWLDDNNANYIYYRISDIQEMLKVTEKSAIKYMAELEQIGLVEKKRQGLGLPNILYINRFEDCADNAALGDSKNYSSDLYNLQSRPVKITVDNCKNYSSIPYLMNQTEYNQTEKNNIYIAPDGEKQKAKETRKKKEFVPPTLEEVAAYCAERKNNVDPKRFYDFFSSGDWCDSNGKQVHNWKQKVITWETNAMNNKPQQEKEHKYNGRSDNEISLDDLF